MKKSKFIGWFKKAYPGIVPEVIFVDDEKQIFSLSSVSTIAINKKTEEVSLETFDRGRAKTLYENEEIVNYISSVLGSPKVGFSNSRERKPEPEPEKKPESKVVNEPEISSIMTEEQLKERYEDEVILGKLVELLKKNNTKLKGTLGAYGITTEKGEYIPYLRKGKVVEFIKKIV